MSNKNTAFYRGNSQVLVDFSADKISSDGAVILLEKLERQHKLISYFSNYIQDRRDPLRTVHSVDTLFEQFFNTVDSAKRISPVLYVVAEI
ncbi:MAG: transposase [Bacteroidota bacterium]